MRLQKRKRIIMNKDLENAYNEINTLTDRVSMLESTVKERDDLIADLNNLLAEVADDLEILTTRARSLF